MKDNLLKKVRVAFTQFVDRANESIICINLQHCLHIEIEKLRKASCKDTRDKAKLKSLKEELKGKGLVTNAAAIQQCLLDHNESINFALNRCSSSKRHGLSTIVLSNDHQLRITKEQNGYRWTCEVAAPSLRFENISITQEDMLH